MALNDSREVCRVVLRKGVCLGKLNYNLWVERKKEINAIYVGTPKVNRINDLI